MKNKAFSLLDMIKLIDDENLSESYVRYLCGLSSENKYRHQEIKDIAELLSLTSAPDEALNGFVYGYTIPQLNKEFDLLKITKNECLNIELKSEQVSEERILGQLLKNRHYLKLLKRTIHSYTFVSSSKKIYTINNNSHLVQTSAKSLLKTLNSISNYELIDLDSVFTPNRILVSPLNSPNRFITGDYLLTKNQEDIKRKILDHITSQNSSNFIGLTGGPGTGKTLLIYDIAKELAKTKKILLVHSGILCEGHSKLNESLVNIQIVSAKEITRTDIPKADIIVVDEAHRLYEDIFNKITNWAKKEEAFCLFSYDMKQTLSKAEIYRKIFKKIDDICAKNIYRLTNKIRTNKELATFIRCLFNLNEYKSDYKFPNVKILYDPDEASAVTKAREIEKNNPGFAYISFTPSLYKHTLDFQKSFHNTHNVIGQEFDGVCMILSKEWQYNNNKLTAPAHPNPDYLFNNLLYQGLTRVRKKLFLIICSKNILTKLLDIVDTN